MIDAQMQKKRKFPGDVTLCDEDSVGNPEKNTKQKAIRKEEKGKSQVLIDSGSYDQLFSLFCKSGLAFS